MPQQSEEQAEEQTTCTVRQDPKSLAASASIRDASLRARGKMIAAGITHFVWRTGNDNRVCEECESRGGMRFSWTTTHATDDVKFLPESECPGVKDGCRCYASPIFEDDDDDDDVLMLGPGDPRSGGVSRPAFPAPLRPAAPKTNKKPAKARARPAKEAAKATAPVSAMNRPVTGRVLAGCLALPFAIALVAIKPIFLVIIPAVAVIAWRRSQRNSNQ